MHQPAPYFLTLCILLFSTMRIYYLHQQKKEAILFFSRKRMDEINGFSQIQKYFLSKVHKIQMVPQPAPLNVSLQHTEQRPTSCPHSRPLALWLSPHTEHLGHQARGCLSQQMSQRVSIIALCGLKYAIPCSGVYGILLYLFFVFAYSSTWSPFSLSRLVTKEGRGTEATAPRTCLPPVEKGLSLAWQLGMAPALLLAAP